MMGYMVYNRETGAPQQLFGGDDILQWIWVFLFVTVLWDWSTACKIKLPLGRVASCLWYEHLWKFIEKHLYVYV